LQYIWVRVDKIKFGIACYQEICKGVTFIGTQLEYNPSYTAPWYCHNSNIIVLISFIRCYLVFF